MIAQSNITSMLVFKNTAYTGGKLRSALAAGELGVYVVGTATSNANLNAIAAGTRYTIATKNAKGVIVETPVLTRGQEKNYHADYVAPVVQTSAIGYNGTSGSIEKFASQNDYVVHIFWKDNTKIFGYGQPVKFAAYRAAGGASEATIAAGIVANFNKNFSREVPKLMKAEVLLSDAGVATSGGTAVVTNGSNYITIAESAGAAADAGKYNADGATIVAGDFIRFGTATTDPCYKVVSITGGGTALATIKLDTAYQGATNAAVAAAAMEVITAALAGAASAGIKLSAIDSQAAYEAGIVAYSTLTFDVQMMDGFGATTLTKLTGGNPGSGSYYEVADNEWFLQGNKGEPWRVGNYPKTVTLEAVPGTTYSQMALNYGEVTSKTINGDVKAYGTVLLAFVSGSAIYTSMKTTLGTTA